MCVYILVYSFIYCLPVKRKIIWVIYIGDLHFEQGMQRFSKNQMNEHQTDSEAEGD